MTVLARIQESKDSPDCLQDKLKSIFDLHIVKEHQPMIGLSVPRLPFDDAGRTPIRCRLFPSCFDIPDTARPLVGM